MTANFYTDPTTGFVDLKRLDDDKVLCCICFEYFPHDKLTPTDNGKVWDICIPCAPEAGL